MTPALTPWPLRTLLGRIALEWDTRHRILDLPSGKFFRPEVGIDVGTAVGGRPVATPLGPAAGPHTQMAQNIVLGWLAGARVFELKTVQVRDDLDIPRPCIDVAGVGYNVEWSQELRLAQSLDEYVKAWMALHLLASWAPLRAELGDPGPCLFDMSVGYDLAGIRSPEMAGFIEGLLDATAAIERLRPEVAAPFDATLEIPSRVVGGVTLSTFHGCPPDEIEAIARHLMTENGLDVVVKLNPTLLGIGTVSDILRRLGHDDVRLTPAAFDADLQYDRALEMIGSLHRSAATAGRTVGIKLTNTLVVANHLRRLPGDVMYLSGPPLHVMAVTLLDRLVGDLDGLLGVGPEPGPVAVSFSAGIDRNNVTPAVGLGLTPVTMCTVLLGPGGYGNLSGMLHHLGKDMREAGVSTVPDLVRSRHEAARKAGRRDAVAAYAAELADAAGAERFGKVATTPRLRRVERPLGTWDCVSCNICVTVCPNDAMLHVATPPEGLGLAEKWQYFCLAEWCNDCGNCTPFCPEIGDPSRDKPRLFLDPEAFAVDQERGYLVRVVPGGVEVESRNPVDPGDPATLVAVLSGVEGWPVAGS